MKWKLLVGAGVALGAGLSAALMAGTACHVDVAYYCCSTQKSCTEDHGGGVITGCLPRYPDRPYCDDDGVFPGSDGIGRTCVADPFPNLGTICISADDCTDPAHPVCVNQHCQGCSSAADCTSAAPVCSDEHKCVGCTQEAECASYPSTPHCGSSGSCVLCRDGGDCTDPAAPVCDSGAATCRACQADAECGSEICDEGSGRCVPESEIVYVDGASGVSSGPCTKTAPCKTIQLGVDAVSGIRSTVHVAPGSYSDRVTISSKTVQISARGVDLAPIAGPGLDVKGASTVVIEGIRIKNVGGVSGDGVRCTDDGSSPTLSLIGVLVTKNSAIGVNATKCALTLTKSVVIDNDGGGVSLSLSDFSLINNMIVGNGGVSSTFGGVLVSGNPPSGVGGARIEFNTITRNSAQATSASGLICSLTSLALGFANSIVYGNNGTAGQVSGCSWAYSDIGPDPVPGTGNISTAPIFVNEAQNDYHLAPNSPGINAADPSATVNEDIDGDARPAGGRSDMGADEVP
jgi:hypothetical protein